MQRPGRAVKKFLPRVAPPELIRADLGILKANDRLDTTKVIEQLLFIQSIEGRAHNGSGAFDKQTFVNTSIDDVVRALGLDAAAIKAERQRLIDDIAAFANDTLNEEKRDRLVTRTGEPFLGIPFFRDRRVNARDVLRGLYIGGLRDNPDLRKETEAKFNIKIGCGECRLVDTRVMTKMGLDGERLAHEPHEDRIAEFIEKGLIVRKGLEETPAAEDTLRYFYIRHRLGPGQSDDAAIVSAGVLYNSDVALGVFLADAIDTLEKYAPVYQDQDQELAFYIARGFKELRILREDVHEIAFLAAIPEAEENLVPDSSLRYLLSVDARTNRNAIETHLAFIEGRPIAEIPISFKRILTTQFYPYIKRRLLNARRLDSLSLPPISVEDLGRPIGDFLHKNFIVVPKEARLSEVVRKFRESKSEIVIVADKARHVIGTLSAADLIRYFGADRRT